MRGMIAARRSVRSILDFRSLFLHYENGVLICDAPVVADIRRDIEKTMEVSHRITMDDIQSRPWWQKVLAPSSICSPP